MKKIVVNGSFDIIHYGHLQLLKFAKSLGDYVLVCIDSDSRIQELKGISRPINKQDERVELLLNLRSVDEVQVFDSQAELETILSKYQADIMVKGSDHIDGRGTGKKYCKEVVYYDRIQGFSTTKKIQDTINR